MLQGKHLIAGDWVGGDETFANLPVEGGTDRFAMGTPGHIEAAAAAPERAFAGYSGLSRQAGQVAASPVQAKAEPRC